MYSLENKTLVKSFIEEVFNKRDLAAADKYLSQRNPMAGQGQEGFKQFINAYFF